MKVYDIDKTQDWGLKKRCLKNSQSLPDNLQKVFSQEFPNGPVIIVCLLLRNIPLTHKPYLTSYPYQIENSLLSCSLSHLTG